MFDNQFSIFIDKKRRIERVGKWTCEKYQQKHHQMDRKKVVDARWKRLRDFQFSTFFIFFFSGIIVHAFWLIKFPLVSSVELKNRFSCVKFDCRIEYDDDCRQWRDVKSTESFPLNNSDHFFSPNSRPRRSQTTKTLNKWPSERKSKFFEIKNFLLSSRRRTELKGLFDCYRSSKHRKLYTQVSSREERWQSQKSWLSSSFRQTTTTTTTDRENRREEETI